MEAINDSSRLIAKSIELINKFINRPIKEEFDKTLQKYLSEQDLTELFDSVELLESALEKLTNKI